MSRSYPHERLYLKDSIALGEGTSNALIVFQKRDRKEIAIDAWNCTEAKELQRKVYHKVNQELGKQL